MQIRQPTRILICQKGVSKIGRPHIWSDILKHHTRLGRCIEHMNVCIGKKLFLAILFYSFSIHLFGQSAEIKYLSGRGSDQTVNWEFYCTGGMNSGKWTTIAVPSCWELQGFGKYDYGLAKDDVRGKEEGMYKYSFSVPSSWKNKIVKIVFEGVMTDADVKINGKSAGPIHQGAFYEFKYDISSLLSYSGKNELEVKVSKHSANESVNSAERKADYWIFGGIFRPVFL